MLRDRYDEFQPILLLVSGGSLALLKQPIVIKHK